MADSLATYTSPSTSKHGLDSETASIASLEDEWPVYTSGAPLSRMIPLEQWSSSGETDEEVEEEESCEELEYLVRDEEINYIEEDTTFFDLTLSEYDGEDLTQSTCIQCSSPEHAQDTIDYFAANESPSMTPRLLLYATPSYPSRPLLIRHLPFSSYSTRELAVWRYLNSSTLRRDEWNPAPPALLIEERELGDSSSDRLARIIEFGDGYESEERDKEAFVVMDGLSSLEDNPLETEYDVIDFTRQMLQSLVFLHENNIAQVSFTFHDHDSLNIMMDIGMAPRGTRFSRMDFPVKYYLVDYSKATRLRLSSRRQLSPVGRFSVTRGRSRHPVHLTSSRPGPISDWSEPTDDPGSVEIKSHSVPRQGRRHSRIAESSSRFYSPEDESATPTPKQFVFFVDRRQRSSSVDLSDPEADSVADSEEFSSDDEETVRSVTPATRTALFSADMKNLANTLDQVVPTNSRLQSLLHPILQSMRRAKAMCLTASDVLEKFEYEVRKMHLNLR